MYKYRRIIVAVVAALLVLALVIPLVIQAFGANSSSIKQEISALQERAEEIAEEQERLDEEIAANKEETLSLVDKKSQIDRNIELTRLEVENINEQIRQYNLLIAEKQAELDELKVRQDELIASYKLRLRAMQEQGTTSYWSVIFQSSSFSDMLNSSAMVEEIARSDRLMIDNLRAVAEEMLTAKEELAAEKVLLEEKKIAQTEAEALLAQQRAEADAVLIELIENKELLLEEAEKYDEMESDLSAQIAQKEKDYLNAIHNEQNSGNSGGGGGGGNSGGGGGSFRYPLPPGVSYVSSAYGYRVHPITGNYTFHTGVDLAASQGTAIYATKSGTVTGATYTYTYGNYVTINHGDGYSSLYGHMTHYVVSNGQYVEQGQVIGYVGSTGWSTGPHLHFNIYYNGSTVNPMNYITVQ
ncbi:MAG: peptidoglycan DD-metalloendopeptidase family protein [Oscillospiraceae bacterium]|jgi:murein DD-endopeptidase MepM/ murein hydrolase activator NlpD|nr:peptidoglycan DD-metalloendopeptidase family protein [Oscillospiraceae bacterium]